VCLTAAHGFWMDGLCLNALHVWRDSSSNLYMYLYTIFTVQSVSQQLYRDNRKIIQQSVFPEENSVTVQLKSVQWCFIFVVKRYYFNSFISPIEAKMFKSFILICLCASKHQPISREQLICMNYELGQETLTDILHCASLRTSVCCNIVRLTPRVMYLCFM